MAKKTAPTPEATVDEAGSKPDKKREIKIMQFARSNPELVDNLLWLSKQSFAAQVVQRTCVMIRTLDGEGAIDDNGDFSACLAALRAKHEAKHGHTESI